MFEQRFAKYEKYQVQFIDFKMIMIESVIYIYIYTGDVIKI